MERDELRKIRKTLEWIGFCVFMVMLAQCSTIVPPAGFTSKLERIAVALEKAE
jgi:hypothetical protein